MVERGSDNVLFYQIINTKTKEVICESKDLEELLPLYRVGETINTVNDMDYATIHERMVVLDDILRGYSEHYYKHNESLIDDGIYDLLMKQLEKWELENPQYKDENSMANKVGSSL